MLIEGLPDQRLDHRLPAHIKLVRSPIEFLEHARSHVNINALNRLHHAAFPTEETGNVFSLIGQPSYGVC
jgi:hypothetical protein